MSASINMMSISRTLINIKFCSKSNQWHDTQMKKKKLLPVMLLFFFVLCSPDEQSQTLVKTGKMLKCRLITATVAVMPAIKRASVILLI